MKKGDEDEEEKLKISRKPSTVSDFEANEEDTDKINNVLSSGGSSLDSDTKEFMEPRFGYDFGNVRIHSGNLATRSAESLNALAYTVGNRIVFGEGQYTPTTKKGKRLIAHELAHVVQQTHGFETHGSHLMLQRGNEREITKTLHPEETIIFSGPLKLPFRNISLDIRIELRNVDALIFHAAGAEEHKSKLGLQCLAGVEAAIQELGKPNLLEMTWPSPSEMPPLNLVLDAGYSKVLQKDHVKLLVKRAAIKEIKGLAAKADKPADLLEAIVNIMDFINAPWYHDKSDPWFISRSTSQPEYYIKVKKNISDKAYVGLLEDWFQIRNQMEPDEEGNWPISRGSKTRGDIQHAVEKTAPVVNAVIKAGGDKSKLVTRYKAKAEQFTQRAVWLQVQQKIERSLEEERTRRPVVDTPSAEEVHEAAMEIKDTLQEAGEAFHRLIEEGTTAEVEERLIERLNKYRKEWWTDKWVGPNRIYSVKSPPPIPSPEYSINFADGIAWLKGILDGVIAISTVLDPHERKKVFESPVDSLKFALELLSGAAAFLGAGAYGMARVVGKTDLASKFLTLSTQGIAKVGNVLLLVGAAHGIFVLVDPRSSQDERIKGGFEFTSATAGLAAAASRRGLLPEVFAEFGGPLGISLLAHELLLEYGAAPLYEKGKIGITKILRPGVADCHRETSKVAEEAQKWTRNLLVVQGLMGRETDPLVQRELRSQADVYRSILIEETIKPYIEWHVWLARPIWLPSF